METRQITLRLTSPLSLKLFQALRKRPGSVFLSGQGLASILTILRLAASGETQRELSHAMSELGSNPLAALLKLRRSLRRRSGEVTLDFATRIWLSRDAKPQFAWPTKLIEKGLFDPAQAKRSAEAINKWASRATGGLIRAVVHDREIDSQSKVILTDALSFNGKWRFPFDPNATREQAFWIGSDALSIPMMREFKSYEKLSSAHLRVYQGEGWDCLEMPYEKSGWRALFIKPEQVNQTSNEAIGAFPSTGRSQPPELKVSLDELEARLSGLEAFTELVGKLEPMIRPPVIHIPAFRVESVNSLVAALADCGVRRIFSECKSELAALTGRDPTWIGQIRQNIVFAVDEAGTKAAATVCALERGAPRRVHVFRADHPFLVVLYELESQEILFIGRFAPSASPSAARTALRDRG